MNRHALALPATRHRGCALLMLLVVAGCASPPAPPPALATYLNAISISPKLAAKVEEYRSLPVHKALASSVDGTVIGYGYLGDYASDAVRTAMARCQAAAADQPCRVVDVDNRSTQEVYRQFVPASAAALATLKPPPDSNYAMESRDWNAPAPDHLRTELEGYHSPTPVALPGIETIGTAALARQLRTAATIVIDARGWGDVPGDTLPNAFNVDWAGISVAGSPDRDAASLLNLDRLMRSIAPDKSRSVTTFCISSQCWHSANTAMRLKALGYARVQWYRGGLEAWQAAGLPVVKSVYHATAFAP